MNLKKLSGIFARKMTLILSIVCFLFVAGVAVTVGVLASAEEPETPPEKFNSYSRFVFLDELPAAVTDRAAVAEDLAHKDDTGYVVDASRFAGVKFSTIEIASEADGWGRENWKYEYQYYNEFDRKIERKTYTVPADCTVRLTYIDMDMPFSEDDGYYAYYDIYFSTEADGVTTEHAVRISSGLRSTTVEDLKVDKWVAEEYIRNVTEDGFDYEIDDEEYEEKYFSSVGISREAIADTEWKVYESRVGEVWEYDVGEFFSPREGYSVKEENGIFYLCSDTSAEVIGFAYDDLDRTWRDIDIPETVEGVPVTAVGDGAFRNSITLRSIKLPASVTSIGNGAFMECYFLKQIDFPGASTATIGDYAFYGSGCETTVEALNMPETVLEYGKNDQTVVDFTGLQLKITYPWGTSETYTVPETATVEQEEDGWPYWNIEDAAKNVKVTVSADYYHDKYAMAVDISIDTEFIRKVWGWSWSDRDEFLIARDGYTMSRDDDFIYIIDENKTTEDGKNEVYLYRYIGEGGDVVTPVTYNGNPVTRVLEYCFSCNDNIKSVELSEGIIRLEEFAMCGSPRLSSVKLPESLKYIGIDAFYGTEVTAVTVPYGVEYIDYFREADPEDETMFYEQFAFDETTTVTCYEDSAAHEYCKKHKIPFTLVGKAAPIPVEFYGAEGGSRADIKITPTSGAAAGESFGTTIGYYEELEGGCAYMDLETNDNNATYDIEITKPGYTSVTIHGYQPSADNLPDEIVMYAGDFNGNALIDLDDIAHILTIYYGGELTGGIADYNENGKVDYNDAEAACDGYLQGDIVLEAEQ